MVHDSIMGTSDRFSLFLAEKESGRDNLKDLHEIVAAIESGDGEKARAVAGAHVKKFNKIMKNAQANP